MNTTPPVDASVAPPVKPVDSLQDSLFKSLRLTVDDMKRGGTAADGGPLPDSGADVPATDINYGEGNSLAERIVRLNKTPDVVETPPVVTPPVEVPPVAPPAAVVTPPVEVPPVAPPAPEPPRVKVHEMPKPIRTDDVVLPPPPINLDLTGLDEDEREEVQTAIFAEQKYPDRHKGYAQRQLDFIKQHKAFVQKQEQEDPNVSFDNGNAAYQKFLQATRPNTTASERKRLERERLMEEAAVLAEKRLSTKTRRLEEEVNQLKATPVVERTLNDYKSLLKEIMPKDEGDPIITETVTNMSNKATEAAKEFLQLASSLKAYDSRNDTHRWLADFIQEQGELYSKSGHASLKRGSKSFVPRSKYNSLAADERGKHFTFSEEDVLQLIAVNAKAAAEYHATNERDRLKKAGYTRATVANTPPPIVPPVVVPPPADVSPRASSGVSTGAPIPVSTTRDPFLRFLGQ